MKKTEPWDCRHAIQLAALLPEWTEDARTIVWLVGELIAGGQSEAQDRHCTVTERAMTDDSELIPREALEFSDEELEELIRDVIGSMLRPDLAERALAWLDRRLTLHNTAKGPSGLAAGQDRV
jgi:hypothetical protein